MHTVSQKLSPKAKYKYIFRKFTYNPTFMQQWRNGSVLDWRSGGREFESRCRRFHVPGSTAPNLLPGEMAFSELCFRAWGLGEGWKKRVTPTALSDPGVLVGANLNKKKKKDHLFKRLNDYHQKLNFTIKVSPQRSFWIRRSPTAKTLRLRYFEKRPN